MADGYLMEHPEEALRLEIKTDIRSIREQALWAGIKPGMRVADIGCGPGKTTSVLYELVQPAGEAVGFDASRQRIEHACQNYGSGQEGGNGIRFVQADISGLAPGQYGLFDFIWVRFVLEYYRSGSFEIVKKASELLRPGGVLCLIDLDHNCLSHYGLPPRLENTLFKLIRALEEKADFDPYAGRKLYSFLFDMGFKDIDVNVSAHHLIFGQWKQEDLYNWFKKIEVATSKINFPFDEYEDGGEGFLTEFLDFFKDPRRFIYTPLIACRGVKP
ncbi:MAG: class I SAM-dependent methyltransferase [Actinomycetota bacterium]|nr:class I SAM-dependent methyltransferase [Actinomycetota bacterium]